MMDFFCFFLNVKTEGVSFFDCNHTISLAIEGREAPRRKPGRPRKPKPTEVELEFLITSDTQKTNEEQPAPEDIVDPEQVRNTCFKTKLFIS